MDKDKAAGPAIGPIPPFTAGRCYYILRPPRSGQVEAHAVNPLVSAVLTHWDPQAQTRLNHLLANCPNCKRLGPPRWYGYLAVTRGPRYGIELAEITAFAASHCSIIRVGVESIRGRLVSLIRLGKNDRGKVRCQVSPAEAARTFELPPPIDQYGALTNLFQFRPTLAGVTATPHAAAPAAETTDGGAL